MKSILTISAISGLLAVVLGAFGAHALKKMISPEMLEVYKTGVQYQFYHTFALFNISNDNFFQKTVYSFFKICYYILRIIPLEAI